MPDNHISNSLTQFKTVVSGHITNTVFTPVSLYVKTVCIRVIT